MQDVKISRGDAEARLIKRSDYVSCAVAFIDCKTPGSHLKQNYAMIGPGVVGQIPIGSNLARAGTMEADPATIPI